MQVWKYTIDATDSFKLSMPEDAEVLSVQVQNGGICMWAKVNPNNLLMPRCFCLRGTGHDFTGKEGRFVGTFQLAAGTLVFHLFEEVS